MLAVCDSLLTSMVACLVFVFSLESEMLTCTFNSTKCSESCNYPCIK